MGPSPKVAQEPYPYDSDSSCDPIYPAPSTARLTALYAKKQQPAQKENHRPPPLHDVPFRTVNWAPPSSPSTSSANLGHLRKQDPNLSPGSSNSHSHTHPTKDQTPTRDQLTPNLPSPPETTIRQRCSSHPNPQNQSTTIIDIKKEEEDDNSPTELPLGTPIANTPIPTPRRSSAPSKLQSLEERRLRRQQKLQWKARLALDEAKYGAEQRELLSASRGKFSPDPEIAGVRVKSEEWE